MLTKQRRIYSLLIFALIVGALGPMATPRTAYAQEEEYGYYWKLDFDFETSFDAVLTIEVGPWKNGEMTEVTDSSTATVRCDPVGNVKLDGGDAVFKDSGYLRCSMDLARIVMANHGLELAAMDSYGSMLAEAKLTSSANTVAPIFTHPDAKYSIDFSQTSSVTPRELLSNGAGLLQANFAGVTINTWNHYVMRYTCISHGGPCDARFDVNGQNQSFPTAGQRTEFATGPTGFQIGTDGGNFFSGRLGHLIVDPGNSAH